MAQTIMFNLWSNMTTYQHVTLGYIPLSLYLVCRGVWINLPF
jgi:hypothetical protein